MDIAIYYLDPTKHSAKLTQATARDLNLIAADNFGRTAAKNGKVKLFILVEADLIMKPSNACRHMVSLSKRQKQLYRVRMCR